jgi:phosphocarrier protein HPr
MTAWLTGSVLVTNRIGLHARPAVSWTKRAKKFHARIQMATTANGPWVDAKSIVKVMGLRAKQNSILHIRASGDDAELAIFGLKHLVETNFDEGVLDAKHS